jgi:hypothetical protein
MAADSADKSNRMGTHSLGVGRPASGGLANPSRRAGACWPVLFYTMRRVRQGRKRKTFPLSRPPARRNDARADGRSTCRPPPPPPTVRPSCMRADGRAGGVVRSWSWTYGLVIRWLVSTSSPLGSWRARFACAVCLGPGHRHSLCLDMVDQPAPPPDRRTHHQGCVCLSNHASNYMRAYSVLICYCAT